MYFSTETLNSLSVLRRKPCLLQVSSVLLYSRLCCHHSVFLMPLFYGHVTWAIYAKQGVTFAVWLFLTSYKQ